MRGRWLSKTRLYLFAKSTCRKYRVNFILKTKKNFFPSPSRRERGDSIGFPLHASLQTASTKAQKSILTSRFYSPRVYRVTSGVKAPRDTLHRCSAHAEKNNICSHVGIADYRLTTVEIMFRRSCREFDGKETASLALSRHDVTRVSTVTSSTLIRQLVVKRILLV